MHIVVNICVSAAWHTGNMLAMIFLCCLHLVVLQARPPPPGFGTNVRYKLLDGLRYSRSSGSERAVKKPNHVPQFLPFSTNAAGVPQLSIKNTWDSLETPTRQLDTVKLNKLSNLDRLTKERIKQEYGPGGSKPLPQEGNPPQGIDQHQVFTGLPWVAKDKH